MKPLVVVGAGGFGREVAALIQQMNQASSEPVWRVVGLPDDSEPPKPEALKVLGLEVVGPKSDVAKYENYVVSINDAEVRERVANLADGAGASAAAGLTPCPASPPPSVHSAVPSMLRDLTAGSRPGLTVEAGWGVEGPR